jgi:hypothetical protein
MSNSWYVVTERSLASDIVVFGFGIIPAADVEELSRMGVAKILTSGASTTEVVDWARFALGREVAENRPGGRAAEYGQAAVRLRGWRRPEPKLPTG